jgi:hypothetical protein
LEHLESLGELFLAEVVDTLLQLLHRGVALLDLPVSLR